jgi:hypothetical protein
MNADIIASDYYAHLRLTNDSIIYIFGGGTFSARYDVWQGEWVKIANTSPTVTTTTTTGIGSNTGAPSQTATPTAIGGPIRYELSDIIGVGGGGVGTTSGTIFPEEGDSIPIEPGTDGGLIADGTLIFLVNAADGSIEQVTASGSVSPTDTHVPIYPHTFQNVYPSGSTLVVATNQYSDGSVTGTETQDTAAAGTDWFLVHELTDDLTDTEYDTEITDTKFFTNENAGDGATAGMVIDENGIKSYNSSSTTPRTAISPATGVTTLYEAVLGSNAFFRPVSGYGASFSSLTQYEAFGAAWVATGAEKDANTAMHIKTSLTRPPSGGYRLFFNFQGSLKDVILDYRVFLTVDSSSESITQSGDKSADITFSTYQSAATGNYICIKAVATSGFFEKAVFRIDLIRGWLQYGDSLTMPTISAITINTGTNI